jgi:hypothetical protein
MAHATKAPVTKTGDNVSATAPTVNAAASIQDNFGKLKALANRCEMDGWMYLSIL